uniref:Ubiquitin-like protease family profile domain-containing protein n=1 Tax=Glossina pallidipes TaxID=7398 RepID=A0A1A9ZWA0_GLOPL
MQRQVLCQQQQMRPPTLTYPSGRISVSITKMDYEMLSPGRWLNDNIVEFYGLWLRDRLDKSLRDHVGIWSSFVYAQICQQRWNILHRSARRTDLFNMSALLLHICTRKHCLLAIVRHSGVNQGKSGGIYVVDSKKNVAPGVEIIHSIREFLSRQYQSRFKAELDFSESHLPATVVQTPQRDT